MTNMKLMFIIFATIFCLPVFCYECYIPGRCNGLCYKIIKAPSAEACIGNCSMNYKCSRSTFDPDLQHCFFFNSTCTIDFEHCPKKMCVTSDKKCIYGKLKGPRTSSNPS